MLILQIYLIDGKWIYEIDIWYWYTDREWIWTAQLGFFIVVFYEDHVKMPSIELYSQLHIITISRLDGLAFLLTDSYWWKLTNKLLTF